MARLKLYTKGRKGRTVEQKLDDQVIAIAKLRKADAAARKKRKSSRLARLKRNITRLLKGRHSSAGKKYLRNR